MMNKTKYPPEVRATLKKLVLKHMAQGKDMAESCQATAETLSNMYLHIGEYNRGGVQSVYYQERDKTAEIQAIQSAPLKPVTVPVAGKVKEVLFNFDGLSIKVTTE